MARVTVSSNLLYTSARHRRNDVSAEAEPPPFPRELFDDNFVHIVCEPVLASDLDDSVSSGFCWVVVSVPWTRRAHSGAE